MTPEQMRELREKSTAAAVIAEMGGDGHVTLKATTMYALGVYLNTLEAENKEAVELAHHGDAVLEELLKYSGPLTEFADGLTSLVGRVQPGLAELLDDPQRPLPEPVTEFLRGVFDLMGKAYAARDARVARRELPAEIQVAAETLIARAKASGVVLTVEQIPQLPLAMGHHLTVASVRPARGAA